MEMRREAHHLVEEFREKRKHALLNLLSDSVAGTTFFVMLAAAEEARCGQHLLPSLGDNESQILVTWVGKLYHGGLCLGAQRALAE